MTDAVWDKVCVLCSTRNRQTRLQHGHCCAACADRLTADLRAIPELAAMASASLMPGQGSTGTTHAAYGSRPPVLLDALDPALAHVPGHDAPLLVILEEWCRLIREERGLAPYGVASASYTGNGGPEATLTHVCGFLVHHVEWAVSEPGFPLEDYADEVRQCVRALRRWDVEREHSIGRIVDCPHDDGEGTCGYRFRVDGNDVDAYFTCPRCGSEWSVDRLMLVVAETTDASMWLDADAVISRFGIDRTTLGRWVRSGKITRRHGLYDIKPIALAQRRA